MYIFIFTNKDDVCSEERYFAILEDYNLKIPRVHRAQTCWFFLQWWYNNFCNNLGPLNNLSAATALYHVSTAITLFRKRTEKRTALF